jgi:hypothetical protein
LFVIVKALEGIGHIANVESLAHVSGNKPRLAIARYSAELGALK